MLRRGIKILDAKQDDKIPGRHRRRKMLEGMPADAKPTIDREVELLEQLRDPIPGDDPQKDRKDNLYSRGIVPP